MYDAVFRAVKFASRTVEPTGTIAKHIVGPLSKARDLVNPLGDKEADDFADAAARDELCECITNALAHFIDALESARDLIQPREL